MRLSFGRWLTVAILSAIFVAVLLISFERPPVSTVQRGFRGTGMELVYNPRTWEATAYLHQEPTPSQDIAETDGPKARESYQNVQVLGDLSVAQFNRLMASITEWVSPIVDNPEPGAPERGCNYCHNPENMAEDSVYTKVVSRRMLQMVKHINEHWKSHVGETGVTCYTCHRGKPVPNGVWAQEPMPDRSRGSGFTASSASQNLASASVGMASLPYDVFAPFLGRAEDIRVIGRTPLPSDEHRDSIKQTEWTYGLMMHFSTALNANCTHCHNSRSFFDWDQSNPQRASAWHAIRMVRDVNMSYIEPLRPVFPASRLGPMGDPLKANCTTCHQGAYKPLYGESMLDEHPELRAISATPAPPEAARR